MFGKGFWRCARAAGTAAAVTLILSGTIDAMAQGPRLQTSPYTPGRDTQPPARETQPSNRGAQPPARGAQPGAGESIEGQLNLDEKKLVQEGLIWLGYYNGWADGAFGRGTRDAIAQWQQKKGLSPTGVVDGQQALVLAATALSAQDEVGWKSLPDRQSRITIGYPSKMMTKEEPSDSGGVIVSDPKGGASLMTVRLTDIGAGQIGALFTNLTSDKDTQVLYKFQRDNLFIISGNRGSGKFYARYEQRGSEIRGYDLIWSAERQAEMAPLSLVMSNSFYPFGPDSPQAEPSYPTLGALAEASKAPSSGGQQGGQGSQGGGGRTATAEPPPAGGGRQTPAEPPGPGAHEKSSGTGFVVSKAGYIVTNNHVVAGCAALKFGDADAQLIGRDEKRDLAVLRVAGSFDASIPMRSDSQVQLGEPVAVLGFPYRGMISTSLNLTNGIVTSLAGISDAPWLFQLNAQIQPGNSGGPIVDDRGQVIGVVVSRVNDMAIAEATGTIPQNINFGIRGELLASFLLENGVIPDRSSRTQKATVQEVAAKLKDLVQPVLCY